MSRKFELLVFDWDGTLMDSAAAIAESLQAACAELGATVPDDARARYVIGLGLHDALAHAVPDLEPGQYPQLLELYRRHFLRRDCGTRLFGGAAEMICELHECGFLLGVATGKSRRGLDRALQETGLAGYFHATRCADEGFSKPHPGMLQAVMDNLAAAPGSTLMIGDTTHDLEMAVAAGVASVAVTYGAHEPAALSACTPLAMFDGIPALRDWLLLRR